MKTLKRILVLALAVVMSLSMFACGDEEMTLNPVEGEISQTVDGERVYETLIDRTTPKLSFNAENNYDKWTEQLKDKFIEKLGMDMIELNASPLNVKIEEKVSFEETYYEKKTYGSLGKEYFDSPAHTVPAYTRIRFLFNSEYGQTIPCYLVVPNTGAESYPLVIVLQGHHTRASTSVGIPYYGDIEEGSDLEKERLRREWRAESYDYALQAVERGYAALAVELRGRGELYNGTNPSIKDANNCEYYAQQEFLLGRTVVGARAWDVSKAIDALSEAELSEYSAKINLDDISITGLSGGATATYYAACYDERIKVAVPCCGFAPYDGSIMGQYHCGCNIIPGAYPWFNMQDLAGLIAPRKLAIVGGMTDKGFPEDAVLEGYETIEQIYASAQAEGNCAVEIVNMGHEWSESTVWGLIETLRAK